MTMQLATRIGAAVVDLVELRNRLDSASPEKAGEFYDRVQDLKRWVKEFGDFAEDALLEYIESGREPVIRRADGDHRLYAKADKTTKCRNAGETARTILETGGPDALAQAVTTQPFKPAACRAILGESWGEHLK